MLASFVTVSLLSATVIAVTSLLTYEILRGVWNLLPRLHIAPRLRALLLIVPIFAAHIINIWLYALVYFLLENFTDYGTLTGNISTAELSYASFIERLYFSASTYASLGLGDIVPSRDLRMLASAEVLNGLVMLGWSISLTYLAMERFWSMPHRSDRKDKQ
ncbi:MAG: two pore domain potassium channel family protein [Proteobacteria bacterium]|nr:two pore domain potassium channel family protein [Pseudomonadota bacterium]